MGGVEAQRSLVGGAGLVGGGDGAAVQVVGVGILGVGGDPFARQLDRLGGATRREQDVDPQLLGGQVGGIRVGRDPGLGDRQLDLARAQ